MDFLGFGKKQNKKVKNSQKQKRKETWMGKSFALNEIITPSVLIGGNEDTSQPFVDLQSASSSHIALVQNDLLEAITTGNLDTLLQTQDSSVLDPFSLNDWLVDPSYQSLSFFDNSAIPTNSLTESVSAPQTLDACLADDRPFTQPTSILNGESPSGKELPGNTTFPGTRPPTIPVTNVDTGGNSLENATSILRSDIQDVIDQVSGIDPTDIYRANINDLKNADISVLSGQISVDYLLPSGQLIGSQFFSTGNHTLLPPADIKGDVIVKINYQGGTPGTYILNGFETKNHSEPFNIDLEFGGGLSASQQAIIQAAAKSVESIISQGLPTAIVDGKLIDDVNFKVSATNLDGAGGTAARTKIDFMRFGTMLPAQSITQFDAADIAKLESSGELFSVVQHELLHGLGFGNLWEAKGLVDYAGTPLAQYNGQEAVKAFQELGGLTSHINLENNGNGSAGLHWNENIFQDEVMTADYNNGKGGNAPISLVTIASLADLGYQVNLNRATPDYGLFGGQKFNTNDLTPEELEAFRELAETSFTNSDEEFIYATMPEVDPETVAPEIWAHAERFWKNGEYYEWREIIIGDWRNGHTISGYVYDYMTNHPSNDNRSRGAKANDPAYWAFISNNNGYPDPNWIVKGEIAKVPIWKENYEQQQEAKRLADLARLEEEQRQEAERKKQAQEKLKNDLAEQEKLKQDQERLKQEAEAKQKELEEQAKKLAEELEKKRQREEWEQEQARLKEIERQKGVGGEDWYLATPLPEFGPVDPFETRLTGETVGNLVPDDYYRFTLSRNGRVTAQLKQLLADADLVLYDVRNRPISYSMRDGITDEQLIADLIPGTYLIRVNSPKGVTTDYELIVKFKHLLSQSEIGPPPGWKPGGNAGGGGGGNAGPIFSDPRIQRIYDTALNNFSSVERAKANAQIWQLQREKERHQKDLQKMLDQMNGEQRAKVHAGLDNARHNANVWVDDIANPIKNKVNSLADGIINKANEFANNLENQVNQISDWGNGWIRDRKDEAKRFIRQGRDAVTSAVNSARSWLTAKLQQIQDGVKSAIWHFFETIKNAYRTGGEINQIIANAAQSFRNTVDQAVRGANDLIAGFKGQVLSAAKWTENMGINIDKFGIKVNFNAYNNIVKPAVDAVADGYNSVIGGIGNTLKGIVDWIEPRTQKVVADIVNAVLGDKTGYLWNEINGVDAKIAATRTGLEKAINNQAQKIKNSLDGLLQTISNTAKSVVNSVANALQTTKLAVENIPIAIQSGIETVQNTAENILAGSKSIAISLITEKAVEIAKNIGEHGAWEIEDVAAAKMQDFLLSNQDPNDKRLKYAWNSPYLADYKDNWVKEHSQQLLQAASTYNISSILNAGVAWNEVGGQPDSWDDIIFYLRDKMPIISDSNSFNLPDNLPGNLVKTVLSKLKPPDNLVPQFVKGALNRIISPPNNTSFGQIQMQIRVAAEELGYDPKNLSEQQMQEIIAKLKDTGSNISLVAKHLAGLRRIDYPNNTSQNMTDDEIREVATRYNRGGSITLDEVKKNTKYGEQIIDLRDHIQSLLT